MAPDPDIPRPLLDAAVGLLGEAGIGGVISVQGASMVPTLAPGTEVQVEFAPRETRFGDLLVFRQADYLVVHRCLGRGRPDGGIRPLRCRGDGVPALDPPVAPSSVIARVQAARRDDGWRTLSTRRGRVYGMLLAAHDLVWGAAAALASRVEGGLRRRGVPFPARSLVVRIDGALLRVADGVLFNRMHPRWTPPAAGVPGESVE